VIANQEVAKIFDQMAAALEILGANVFRINAYARGARVIEELTDDLRALVEEDPASAIKRLAGIEGIGKGLAEKIAEFVEVGTVREHQELLQQVPPTLFELLKIPGIGPKAAKTLWQELGIKSMEDLKNTPDEKLASLPRMGKKTVENIRNAISFNEKGTERVPIGLALPVAARLRDELRKTPGVKRLEYAGSLRRGKETIGDLDFVAVTAEPEALREAFTTRPEVSQVLARGETKCSVRLETSGVVMQADLRLVPEAAFGAALMYFTGSKEHNVRLREMAVKRHQRLNEYGLFAGTEERPQDRGLVPIAAATEEEIYQALGLPYIEPERREDRGELEAGALRLIEIEDIKAELHAHTTASDGRMTIRELAQEAKRRGFHTIAVTDHSKGQPIAGGLSPERLLEHIKAVRAADAEVEGIKILAGSEVDILPDGTLDYEDELLAMLDIVVASPHNALRQEPELATPRLLKAIRHPLVHIIGHPTGRMVGRRQGLEPDIAELAAAAKEADTALELNSNWHRLDLRDTHLRVALDAGCKIAIDCDTHHAPDMDNLLYGILTARRASMKPESCINTWPAEKLHAWLRSKRQ
jgi:DNA polymerase (family 10)